MSAEPIPSEPVAAGPDNYRITLRFTEEEYELFFDMIEHVYDLDWDAFVKEANTRRKKLAESAGDKLEPSRTLTEDSFERIFGSICDKQYQGFFTEEPPK